MQKTLILTTIAAVVAIGAYVVFAAALNDEGMMKGGMGEGMMKGGMMDKGMMGCHPMSAMMCSSSLAASSDGGALVLMGNKLTKYDKDLNVVKEVEIKIDWENWKKMMEQHRKMMMEHHKMMMGEQSESK